MATQQRYGVTLLLALLMVGTASCGGGGETNSAVTASTQADQPLGATSPAPVSEPDSIEHAIQAVMTSGDIPSLAAAIAVGNEVVWTYAFGEQDDLETVYMIGSIEKVFVAMSVLQLVEEGLVDLEADVNEYLPFAVRNPDHPDTPVTLELLLTHQAGLATDFPDSVYYDNDETALRWAVEALDMDLTESPYLAARPSRADYLASYLAPDGANAGADIWIGEPGAKMAYSNLGVQHLAMYLVEVVSGRSFPDYVAEHFLEPLALDGSSFEAGTYPVSQLAVPYARLDDQNVALPATGMSGSGRLRMTASDLATILIAHMNEGEAAGVSILDPESVSLMHHEHVDLYGTDWGQLPFRGEGLGWWLWTERRSGHGGSTPGYSVKMVMQQTEMGNIGVILMMNRGCSLSCDEDWYNSHVVVLRELLLEHAAELQAATKSS